MSRIGKAPIPIPSGVEVDLADGHIVVRGPKGRLERDLPATISVRRDDGRLVVEVADDGGGGADRRRGSGLGGLEDRVAALGGHLEVDSPPGGGTRVRAEIPCAS